MKKNIFLLFCLLFISASCRYPIYFLGARRDFPFMFYNNSNKDVYVVVDSNIFDEEITAGSICKFVFANSARYVGSETPWGEIIKDSAYLYVIDASNIDLSQVYYLSQYQCKQITQDMILGIKTIYHEETVYDGNKPYIFSVYYP